MEKKKKILAICITIVLLIIASSVIIYFTCFKDAKLDENGEGKFGNNNESGLENSGLVQSGEGKEEGNLNEDGYISIEGIKTVGALEFSNIRIRLVSRNKCEFLADVKNTTEEYLESTNVTIKVINENGEVEGSFGGVVSELAAYEPYKFKTYVLKDITDAKDFKIEAVNKS